jgi:hypothetical protein
MPTYKVSVVLSVDANDECEAMDIASDLLDDWRDDTESITIVEEG